MNNLSEKAKLILKAAVSKSNPHRTVMYRCTFDGVTIETPRETLISGKGRDIAAWDSALEELVTQGLLKKSTDKVDERWFKVTPAGYEYAESLGF